MNAHWPASRGLGLPERHRPSSIGLARDWFWFVLLGVALIAAGFVALSAVGVATLATAVAIGALLVVGGVAEMVGSFWSRGWGRFFLRLLSGGLSVALGALFLLAPLDAVLTLTLLLACFLSVGGIFSIVAAVGYRSSGWGWALLSGVLDLTLGGLILLEWPASGLWVLGVFVGISLMFRGIHWLALGLAARTLPPSEAA